MSSAESSVAGLIHRSDLLLTAQQRLRSVLEPQLQDHCWLAGYDDGHLRLQSDSAAWATRIRLQQQSLLQALAQQRGFENLRRISVSVRPARPAPQRKRIHRRIPGAGKDSLQELATSVADLGLRQALERLASR